MDLLSFPSPQSTSSSSVSFHTAPPSPMSTTEDPSPTLSGASYRSVIQISDEIRQHVHIYLDEQLYSSALILLADLITVGASYPDLQKSVFAPAPLHIELVSTLLIHPRYTNQAPPHERVELASQSINFLRNLLAILGPLNANLADAFTFSAPSNRTSRRSRNAIELDDGSSGSDSEDGSERMRGIIANKGKLRNCAKDFWHTVGWAFNCSVRYAKRWKYWKVWLGFMLDVLDADWNERQRLGSDSDMANCLLVRYLSDVRGRSNAAKRVVRSAFADGSRESLREFPEVFANETKEVKVQNGPKRKRKVAMEWKFGDYDEEEAESAFSSSEWTDQASHDEEDALDMDPWMGGPESIILRQRVVSLLSRVADALPEDFADCRDVYEAIYSCVRPVPLPAFSLLLSPSFSSQFPIEVFVSLTQLLLLRLLPSSAPRPQLVSKQAGDTDELTQNILEQCFLPFPAMTSSASDNAKVSVLVENLLRLLLREGVGCHTPSLDAAIEKGIVAREMKAKGDKRRKENSAKRKDEENDIAYLKASGQRLRSLLSWVEQQDNTT